MNTMEWCISWLCRATWRQLLCTWCIIVPLTFVVPIWDAAWRHMWRLFFLQAATRFFRTIKLSGASLSANGLLRSCSWVLKHLSVKCQVLSWGLCSGSLCITWIYYQWSIDWCKSVKQLDYVSESHGATIVNDIFVAWCVQGYASKWKGAYSYITVNDATKWILFG